MTKNEPQGGWSGPGLGEVTTNEGPENLCSQSGWVLIVEAEASGPDWSMVEACHDVEFMHTDVAW